MEDGVAWQLLIPGQFLRGLFVPELGGFALLALLGKLVQAVDLAAAAHQRIAAEQLLAKPGHKGPALLRLVDAVEPEAHLRQLDRHRVEVHPEHVAIGQPHLHLLQLLLEGGMGDGLAQFLLAQLQVLEGQLVDQLIEVGRGAQRHLQQLEAQDVGGGLSWHQLLERVLDLAAGERFGRVVAGALDPVAAGKAVDERAFLVELRTGALSVGHDLLALVVAQLAAGHEMAHLQFVVGLAACLHTCPVVIAGLSVGGVAAVLDIEVLVVRRGVGLLRGRLHLVKVLRREEPSEAEQRLIDRAQLVDAQLCVAHAAALAARLGLGERHQFDHLAQHAIAETHPGLGDRSAQQGHAAGIEQVALERRDPEALIDLGLPFAADLALQLAVIPFGIARPDHLKQALQRVVDVGALAISVAQQRHLLQIPQALQAVAAAVHLRAHRDVVQLWPGLDVEEEQQPVHEAQALFAELLLIHQLEGRILLLVADVPHRLIAQQFDRSAQRVLEIAAHLIGVLVAVLIQAVEQRCAPLAGAEVLPVQQRGRRQEGIGLPLRKERAHLKAQQP